MIALETTRLANLIIPVLTDAQERDLIAKIQARAPGAEEAWDTLIAAHNKAVWAAAYRMKKSLDVDDGYAEALAAFVEAVQTTDLTLGFRLSTIAYPAMHRATIAAAQSVQPVQVPSSTMKIYFRLMERAGRSFSEAYALAVAGGEGITPFTMLAIHRALSETGDVYEAIGDQDEGQPRGRLERFTADFDPDFGPEFFRRMFAVLTPEQAIVTRLAHGFDDGTDDLRLRAGFRQGDPLSDREIGVVLGKSRQAVQRLRQAALDAMRAQVNADIAEDAR